MSFLQELLKVEDNINVKTFTLIDMVSQCVNEIHSPELLSHNETFLIAEISTFNLPIGRGIPTLIDITKELSTQVGFSTSIEDLNKDLKIINEKFRNIFSVQIDQKTNFVKYELKPVKYKGGNNARRLILQFKKCDEYPPMESFRVHSTDGKEVLPQFVIDNVMTEYNRHGGGKIDFSTIALIRKIITDNILFYHDFFFEQYQHLFLKLSGLEKGHVVATILNDWKINSFKIVPRGKNNFIYNSEKKIAIINKDISNIIKKGEILNTKKINDIHSYLLNKMKLIYSKLFSKFIPSQITCKYFSSKFFVKTTSFAKVNEISYFLVS